MQFQEEDHPFIRKALQDEHIHVVSLYYVYKPKTDTPKTKNTVDDENAYKLGPKYGGESTGFHRHMISVVVFSYSETLKIMLIEYADTKMGSLDDYSHAIHWIHPHILDPIYKRFHHLPYCLFWVCLSLVCKHNIMKLHEYDRLGEPF